MEQLTFRFENVVRARQEVLEDFEGPLDLILDLLKRHKIEITDLSISLLLEQYLRWMDERKRLDMEVASEFIAMASHLVYLKTKTLLTLGQPEEDEEVDELILALAERMRQEELARIQVSCAFLSERMDIGRRLITKPMEQLTRSRTYTLTHSPSELVQAMTDIGVRSLRRQPPPTTSFERIVAPEQHPVQEKMESLFTALRQRAAMTWRSLTRRMSRSESIASFLALLELCRMRRVRVDEEPDDYRLTIREDTDALPMDTAL